MDAGPGRAGQLAEALLAETISKQGVGAGQLTIHADRGSPMTAKPVAFLLADLGVTKSHSRPHVSNDNPYSESHFRTLKYRPDFPERFGCFEDAHAYCGWFFAWYNDEHRHSASGSTPRPTSTTARAEVVREQRGQVLARRLRRPPRALRAQAPTPSGAADSGVDQQTRGGNHDGTVIIPNFLPHKG